MTNRSESLATIRHTNAAEEWANSTDRAPVFTLIRPAVRPDDAPDDWEQYDETVVYTMPAKPNPGLALAFLKKARKEGELAMSWLIETAVGEEGYDALAEDLISYQGDPQKLLQSIVQRIQVVAMGGLEGGPKA